MQSNNTVLTRLFTHNTIKDIIENQEISNDLLCSIVNRYEIKSVKGASKEEIISQIYKYIGKSYRYEYFYKNTLLNKLLINIHKINTTIALTEVPISKSKADFILINGKAVVYEIKTELDSFERLESQIDNYYKAFDHVCVVTSESQYEELKSKLGDSPVGIYVMTKNNTISRKVEPKIYREKLDSEIIFKILHKPEYQNIIIEKYGKLPITTQVQNYKECKKLLCSLNIDEFYMLFLKQLKKRSRIDIDYKEVPESLRFLMYFDKIKTNDFIKVQNYLNSKYEGD